MLRAERPRLLFNSFWVGLGFAAAAWAHWKMATGGFVMGMFDDPLRLLQSVYAARGLTPYVDYGFVYPPGFAWFFGKVLHLSQPREVIAEDAVANFILILLCSGLLMVLGGRIRLWAMALALLLLGCVMPLACAYGNVEADNLLFLFIDTLLSALLIRHGQSVLLLGAIAISSLLATLLRWDWILFTAVLQAGAAALVLVAARLAPAWVGQARQTASRLWAVAVAQLAGIAIALAAIIAVAWSAGAVAKTIFFIFQLPVQMLVYRRLALPTPSYPLNMQWLLDLLALALLAAAAAAAWLSARGRPLLSYCLEAGLLLAPCGALLPYTFGRADFPHFLPLGFCIITSALAALLLWPQMVPRGMASAALVTAGLPSVLLTLSYTTAPGMALQAKADFLNHPAPMSNCTALIPNGTRSLFVGEMSYRRFFSSPPAFYLLRPELRPASSFISDEPGVQNSCKLGDEIGNQIKLAQRPLALILDLTPDVPENAKTAAMSNCGRVEAAIATLAAQPLGSCEVSAHVFRVSLVR